MLILHDTLLDFIYNLCSLLEHVHCPFNNCDAYNTHLKYRTVRTNFHTFTWGEDKKRIIPHKIGICECICEVYIFLGTKMEYKEQVTR